MSFLELHGLPRSYLFFCRASHSMHSGRYTQTPEVFTTLFAKAKVETPTSSPFSRSILPANEFTGLRFRCGDTQYRHWSLSSLNPTSSSMDGKYQLEAEDSVNGTILRSCICHHRIDYSWCHHCERKLSLAAICTEHCLTMMSSLARTVRRLAPNGHAERHSFQLSSQTCPSFNHCCVEASRRLVLPPSLALPPSRQVTPTRSQAWRLWQIAVIETQKRAKLTLLHHRICKPLLGAVMSISWQSPSIPQRILPLFRRQLFKVSHGVGRKQAPVTQQLHRKSGKAICLNVESRATWVLWFNLTYNTEKSNTPKDGFNSNRNKTVQI